MFRRLCSLIGFVAFALMFFGLFLVCVGMLALFVAILIAAGAALTAILGGAPAGAAIGQVALAVGSSAVAIIVAGVLTVGIALFFIFLNWAICSSLSASLLDYSGARGQLFPPPPPPPPPPFLPGLDWPKLLACLARSVPPCCGDARAGGGIPDPVDFLADGRKLLEEARRIFEDGQRRAQQAADDAKAYMEQQTGKAREEAAKVVENLTGTAQEAGQQAQNTAVAIGGLIVEETKKRVPFP